MAASSLVPVWTDSYVDETIIARWNEGQWQCPAATFAEFQAMCKHWWAEDPLVRNADGHVGFQTALLRLSRLPRTRQLLAYDQALLASMAHSAGISPGSREQMAEGIFRVEFAAQHRSLPAVAPGTKTKTERKQRAKTKGDPKAAFKPPRPGAAGAKPKDAGAAAPSVSNVVELDDDDDFV